MRKAHPSTLVTMALSAAITVAIPSQLVYAQGTSWFTDRQRPAHWASVNDDCRLPLKQRWKKKLPGPVNSSPVVDLDQGNLYIGSDDRNLYALSRQSGIVRWSFATGGSVRSSATAISEPDKSGNLIHRLFITSSDGNLYSLDPSTGQERWRVGGGVGPFISSPNYADGKVFYVYQSGSSTSTLRAVDGTSGNVLWESTWSGQPFSFALSTATPMYANGFIYLGIRSGGHNFYKIDASTGQVKVRIGPAPSASLGSLTSGVADFDRPLLDVAGNKVGDVIYTSTRDGIVSAFEFDYGITQAFLDWEKTFAPAIAREITGFSLTQGRAPNILIVSQPGMIYALEPRTGDVLWSHSFEPNDEWDHKSPRPAIWGGYVFHAAGGQFGTVGQPPPQSKLLAISLADGTEAWRAELDAASFSSPAVADGWLYTADASGSVYAFSPPSPWRIVCVTAPCPCIIATATFGSALAPEVQFVRKFRDEKILNTRIGRSFMMFFNYWYYSFSFIVARHIEERPLLRQGVKIFIYPLIGIVVISEKAYSTVGGEYGALLALLVVSVMIGGIYLSPFALLLRRFRRRKANLRGAILLVGAGFAGIVAAFVAGSQYALGVSTAMFLVVVFLLSGLLFARLWRGAVKGFRKRG